MGVFFLPKILQVTLEVGVDQATTVVDQVETITDKVEAQVVVDRVI